MLKTDVKHYLKIYIGLNMSKNYNICHIYYIAFSEKNDLEYFIRLKHEE